MKPKAWVLTACGNLIHVPFDDFFSSKVKVKEQTPPVTPWWRNCDSSNGRGHCWQKREAKQRGIGHRNVPADQRKQTLSERSAAP